MNVKYLIVGVVALLVGFMATSESGQVGFGRVIMAIGPIVVVGLLVAIHYENKNKS